MKKVLFLVGLLAGVLLVDRMSHAGILGAMALMQGSGHGSAIAELNTRVALLEQRMAALEARK